MFPSFHAQFHSIRTQFIPCTLFLRSAIRYFKTDSEFSMLILQSFRSVCHSPGFTVYGNPGMPFLNLRRWYCLKEDKRQPCCFSLVQFNAVNFIIPMCTHVAVSHISCMSFPSAETMDTVGLKQWTYWSSARAVCKLWINDL